jgi:hypothetical protein
VIHAPPRLCAELGPHSHVLAHKPVLKARNPPEYQYTLCRVLLVKFELRAGRLCNYQTQVTSASILPNCFGRTVVALVSACMHMRALTCVSRVAPGKDALQGASGIAGTHARLAAHIQARMIRVRTLQEPRHQQQSDKCHKWSHKLREQAPACHRGRQTPQCMQVVHV